MKRLAWPRPGIGVSGVLLRIFAGLMVVWLLAPILVVIPLSFTGKQSFEFPPTTWSTEWYHRLFTAPEWIEALTHSIVIALLVVVFAGILGTACAIAGDEMLQRVLEFRFLAHRFEARQAGGHLPAKRHSPGGAGRLVQAGRSIPDDVDILQRQAWRSRGQRLQCRARLP